MSRKETSPAQAETLEPHADHSHDAASSQVHKDPRADDVGASGTLDRAGESPSDPPTSLDHGIDRVLKEKSEPHKDRGADPAHPTAHKDDSADDVGARGATDRK